MLTKPVRWCLQSYLPTERLVQPSRRSALRMFHAPHYYQVRMVWSVRRRWTSRQYTSSTLLSTDQMQCGSKRTLTSPSTSAGDNPTIGGLHQVNMVLCLSSKCTVCSRMLEGVTTPSTRGETDATTDMPPCHCSHIISNIMRCGHHWVAVIGWLRCTSTPLPAAKAELVASHYTWLPT